jgi:hypothetical protein
MYGYILESRVVGEPIAESQVVGEPIVACGNGFSFHRCTDGSGFPFPVRWAENGGKRFSVFVVVQTETVFSFRRVWQRKEETVFSFQTIVAWKMYCYIFLPRATARCLGYRDAHLLHRQMTAKDLTNVLKGEDRAHSPCHACSECAYLRVDVREVGQRHPSTHTHDGTVGCTTQFHGHGTPGSKAV